MKAVEAVKVKFYCFLGIVHTTVYNTVGEPDYYVPQLIKCQHRVVEYSISQHLVDSSIAELRSPWLMPVILQFHLIIIFRPAQWIEESGRTQLTSPELSPSGHRSSRASLRHQSCPLVCHCAHWALLTSHDHSLISRDGLVFDSSDEFRPQVETICMVLASSTQQTNSLFVLRRADVGAAVVG